MPRPARHEAIRSAMQHPKGSAVGDDLVLLVEGFGVSDAKPDTLDADAEAAPVAEAAFTDDAGAGFVEV